jgi:hypothetical protein
MNKSGKVIGSVLFCVLIATVIIGSAVMLVYSGSGTPGLTDTAGSDTVVSNIQLQAGELMIEEESTPLAAAPNGCIGHLIALITAMIYGSYAVIRTMMLRRESDEEPELYRAHR